MGSQTIVNYTQAERDALVLEACAEYSNPTVEEDGSVIGFDWDTGEKTTILSSTAARAFLDSESGKRLVQGFSNPSFVR